ncbi:MAG: hypothetical protein HYV75_01795 [Opitutae bacterium]|nr:hypothetical protein [Opitutae bacterium]
MNNFSHRRPARLLVLLAALVVCSVSRAADPAVLTPVKRQEVLDQAREFLAPRELVAVTNDPFHPEAFNALLAESGRPAGSTAGPAPGSTAVQQPSGPRNERELLQSIGVGLKPSGFFVLGGQPTLVFGQKRVKAGGSLTITFEGNEYTLEVTAISPPHFTLRLNREEFTRTIK